jgi:hypothetical protein
MEYINRGSTNYLYPTCKEAETLTAPCYLIKFYCVSTKDTRYCWVTDSSDYPDRYQKFEFTETDTPTSGTNEVKLDTHYVWDFYIYEYPNTDPAPSTETGLTEVESGQVTINKTATTRQSYSGYQSTYKKYDG